MTRPLPEIPPDPLERFIAIGAALEKSRGWTEAALPFRFASAALVTTRGSPDEIARGVRAVADDLKARAGWFGPMRSSIRFLVAAILLRNDIDPASFDAACSEINDGVRARKLRRNRSHCLLAALILVNNEQQRLDPARLDRMAEVFRAMKKHHPWITNSGDYAPCALLATTEIGVPEMMERIETAYEGLRQRGYSRGDRLQRASHLMFFNPVEDRVAIDRFDALFHAFKQHGLWMHGGDYDEMAVLSFVDAPPDNVVGCVLDHREKIAALRPRPGKEISFSLSCGTAFLELARDSVADILDTAQLLQLQSILDAQAAAMIASTSAASAASSGG